MNRQITAAYALLAFSLVNITWSTLFQQKLPWAEVVEDSRTRGWRAFFYHTSDPGSVCWFGIFSGVLILTFSIAQFILVHKYVRENNPAHLRVLLHACIGIYVIIFMLMLAMNSSVAHYLRGWGARRGLFDHSLVFFICQFTAIGLLYPPTSP